MGFKQLWGTLKEMKNFPETLKFLLAYFLYNDGIQTVIAIASTFAVAPLIRGGVGLDQSTLIVVILMIQFMAFVGALLWGKLAGWLGAKRSIIISLVIWAGVTIYAYFGLKGSDTSRVLEFFILGACIAIVLGGSQAISRSLYAQIIPAGKQAEYYSFYEISDKGHFLVWPAAVRAGEPADRQPAPGHPFADLFLHRGLVHPALRQCKEGHGGCQGFRSQERLKKREFRTIRKLLQYNLVIPGGEHERQEQI